eukprot:TRINITY_DN17315_c0_g1_i4.p1 TRINITY_DN17315_c0_g1~~TRINITY_DN17315_c0_g1_i4.p1  ORF type:complete len:339 (+),score=65.05 TRINITY_DN17315_c0_g1_i4:50-1066(+)
MALAHKYCAWCGYRFSDTDLACINCSSDRGFFEGDPGLCGSPVLESMGRGERYVEERWQKVLWKCQSFEDNYVDKDTFLNSLVTNVGVRPFQYWCMARGSMKLIRVISGVALFGFTFALCWSNTISSESLLVGDATLLILAIGYLMHNRNSSVDVRSMFILFLTLIALTPVLHTLTRDWHDDTILALSIACLCVHLLGTSTSGSAYSVTSLNAAIFASVMLGSRLQSNELVFGFLLLAMEIFGLLPIFSQQLEEESQLKLTLLLAMVGTIALFPLSKFVCMGHLLTVLCVAFVCPLWLMYIQRYKSLIQGQWDEAVPIIGKRQPIIGNHRLKTRRQSS